MHAKKIILNILVITILGSQSTISARIEQPSLLSRIYLWFTTQDQSEKTELEDLQRKLENLENEKKNWIRFQGSKEVSEDKARLELYAIDKTISEIKLKIVGLRSKIGLSNNLPSVSQSRVAPGIHMPTETGAYLEGKKDAEKERAMERYLAEKREVEKERALRRTALIATVDDIKDQRRSKQKKQHKIQDRVITHAPSQPQQSASETELYRQGLRDAQQQTSTHTHALTDRKYEVGEKSSQTSTNTTATAVHQDKQKDSGYYIDYGNGYVLDLAKEDDQKDHAPRAPGGPVEHKRESDQINELWT